VDELDQQIAQVTADLANVRAAITAILTGSQSYRLDTSQNSAQVTRANLSDLRLLRRELQNELAELNAKKTSGGGTFNMMPGW
jgi:hypothetical protein